MASVSSDNIRNVALLSHNGAGKTILSEAMAFATGAITRMGKVEDGNTISDWEPEEVKRTSSIQTSLVPCMWKDFKINLLDTPGYADFRGEVVSALSVADSAILVVAASDGVQVGTQQMWKLVEEKGLPAMVFVSKLDKDNTDFADTVAVVVEAFGKKCVPVQVPVGSQSGFKEVISLMKNRDAAPAELKSRVDETWDRLVEAIAETDDDLATKYLEGEELTPGELSKALKEGILKGEIVPIAAGAPPSGIGVGELMDAIVELLPSPRDTGPVEGSVPGSEDMETIEPDSDSHLAALVFKTATDPYVGKLTYLRTYGGVLKSDSQAWNANKGQQERIGQLFMMRGKSQENVQELPAGDIGAVAKLSTTATGDTLGAKDHPVILDGITFPEPILSMALYPKTKADTDKMTSSLSRILEEDMSLEMRRENDTGEVILSGLGDIHIEMAVEKMRRKFGVEIMTQTPKVPYKETISAPTKVEYKHKKQSGGHGQYGHVWLELQPLPRGGGFEFDNRVVGGAVPREYIPAVEKGVVKALDGGVLAGYPIVDVRAVLFDGTYHPVDSSGVSFEIAASHALSKGVKAASPVLLEPFMVYQIRVPDSYSGDVMGDLNSKRARILGMTPQGDGTTQIDAEAPQGEMLRYATDLRSMTQGRGSFTMQFDHYEEVPQHITQRIVDAMQREKEEARV